MRLPCLILAASLLTSCSEAPSSESRTPDLPEVARAPASLFPGDAAVLSDSAIARILRYPVALPAKVRVALLQVGGRSSYRWYAKGNEIIEASLVDSATASLVAVPRVASAAVLPGLLIPDKFTVPLLREAAARFQADLLLVYRPDCDTYQNAGLFTSTKATASCSVEALLLDVRTGIVPFSTVAAQSLTKTEIKDGESARELLLRAEVAALAGALRTITTGASRFIAEAPDDAPMATGQSGAK